MRNSFNTLEEIINWIIKDYPANPNIYVGKEYSVADLIKDLTRIKNERNS